MILDDVYGSDQMRFPLEQEAADWDCGEAGLVWDEEDVESIARDLGAARPAGLAMGRNSCRPRQG